MRHLLTAPVSRRGRKGVGCRRAIIGLRSPVMAGAARRVTAAAPPVITDQVLSSGTAANRRSETAVHGPQRRRASHNPTVPWPRPGHRL
jgi:hypothetical protein